MINELIDKIKDQMNYRTRQRDFNDIKKNHKEVYDLILKYFDDKESMDRKVRKEFEKLVNVLGLEIKKEK